jgi:lipopolysaccharide transport system ATP-binding protein
MLSEGTIISVENISKCYHIWSSPLSRLTGAVFRRLANLPFLPGGLREWMRDKHRKSCRDFYALEGVSFDVKRGESVGIIGRNGSGKSTLLQIITGTLKPTGGVVEVRGRVAALLELGSGFNPDFTGRENVWLNAALYGLSPKQIEERLEDILAFADIGDFVDQPVKTYSSGMMLRLAFAVIVHIDADILIVDEALAVGDVFFIQKCMTFLRKFQENGVLLLVTHDPSTITSLCQKAVWLDHGHMRASGDPRDVTTAYLEAYIQANVQARQSAAASATTKPAPAAAAASAAAPEPRPKPAAKKIESRDDRRHLPVKDQRLEYINRSPYRNDLQIFTFDSKAASAGAGGAKITEVVLEDEHGQPLSWIVGGEVVRLRVNFEAMAPLSHPILGFFVKNYLGQWLFGDNTFITSQETDLTAEAGGLFEARFIFQMPLLPAGDYSILLGLAEGEQEDHTMHHWIHDALVFKSVNSSVAGGMIGLPMLEVDIAKVAAPGAPQSAVTLEQVHG